MNNVQSHAERAGERLVEKEKNAAVATARKLIDVTVAIAAREGTLNPPIRAILSEAGVSTDTFYRLFPSKDDLLVAVLADGRNQLASYLDHQIKKAQTPTEAIALWIGAVMAQASDSGAAKRTRPFLVNIGRLSDQFPTEVNQSAEVLIAPLRTLLLDDRTQSRAEHEAWFVYDTVIGVMERHILGRKIPEPELVSRLIRFITAALWPKQP